MKQKLIGRSKAIQEVFRRIGLASGCEFPVLIEGESGTGKQLVAEIIHEKSSRNGKPFVDVNTALLPDDTLLHSVLFGHEKGSFTGAIARRKGKFEEADGGTLFLDEIGDMHLGCQAKILKVIESNKIQRLGSTVPLDVNVRLIFATNHNLKQLVSEKRFRADLLYRLDVFCIYLPPIKNRREDIPILAEHILEKINSNSSIEKNSMDYLLQREYPGNVRELENIIKRGSIYAKGNPITINHLEGKF